MTQISPASSLPANQDLAAFSAARGEPAWMAQWRTDALSAFKTASAPDRAQHLWRYSDPENFEARAVTLVDAAPSVLPALPQLSAEAREKGVRVLTLHEAAADPEHGARVQGHLGTVLGIDFGRIEALNAAAWSAGIYVYVPRGVVLEEPLQLEFELEKAVSYAARRVLVIVDDNARLTLVERHRGGEGDTVVHAASEVFVGQNARVDHVLVQRYAETVHAHHTQRIRLERDARGNTALISFGGKNTKVDTGILLYGEGSEAKTAGLLYGHKRQFFDHHTAHHHTAPHTNSNLDFKVVLGGRSRSAYTGNISIEKSAPFSTAFQENRNLLLSEKARAETIPELEIDIDEVQCSHGATIGPVNADELFYLMSRGIPEKEAIREIVRGFLENIMHQLPQELREALHAELDERLKEI